MVGGASHLPLCEISQCGAPAVTRTGTSTHSKGGEAQKEPRVWEVTAWKLGRKAGVLSTRQCVLPGKLNPVRKRRRAQLCGYSVLVGSTCQELLRKKAYCGSQSGVHTGQPPGPRHLLRPEDEAGEGPQWELRGLERTEPPSASSPSPPVRTTCPGVPQRDLKPAPFSIPHSTQAHLLEAVSLPLMHQPRTFKHS